ncbi:MAG: hypothetical protein HQL84_07440 [Magnetococcales bacterium]|nr:hypothetical protein [Magnetococcales bacterium]MBF0149864.1 hypothetical protein [Magnetococcales bacterium]MBF0173680.1 hypothetical protein [Magnetococcales bacterium]MBF0346602.1 hypothetical protein [Magnetococcales bacterium]MBF0631160.1 hypothetical protein [Magnetococcales bacterium]
MESVDIASIKPGTKITLEFGNKEVILTRLEEPRKFTMEDWFEEEAEIYLLEDTIEEDEPLHYSLEPVTDPKMVLSRNEGAFGIKSDIRDFLGRVVGGIEMEEEEEEEGEEEKE